MGVPKWIVPVSFISTQTLLEFFIYICHINDLVFSDDQKLKTLGILWIIGYIYCFWSFSASSFMNPGYLRPTWIQEVQNDPEYKEEPAENGEKNFCEVCCLPRPLRCHHCRDCGKCVLLYDHHCFFIANCVGFRNFKSFFIFLLVFPIHGFMTITLIVRNLIVSEMPTPGQIITLMFGSFYFLILSVFVISQFVSQLPFLIKNKTWVEYNMMTEQKQFYERAKVKQVNIYDVGLIKNLQCRLGKNPLLWFFPTPNNGNPYNFKTNPEWVPVYKLKFSLLDNFDENSPLLTQYARKRNTPQSIL